MCYSTMVEGDLDETRDAMQAEIDFDAFVDLYAMRANNLTIRIPRGMDAWLVRQKPAISKRIRSSIQAFDEIALKKNEASLQDTELQLRALEDKLHKKETKTARTQYETKLRKRDKLIAALQPTPHDEAIAPYRVFPYTFAPVVVADAGKRLVRPMRYRVLPSSGVELPPQYSVYNARRDSLATVKTWRPLYGKRQALLPFLHFYERVGPENHTREIHFTPKGETLLVSPCLWDQYISPEFGPFRSFAVITDDPPMEVLDAGHDRCPIFLAERAWEAWLHPEGQAQSDQLLSVRQEVTLTPNEKK